MMLEYCSCEGKYKSRVGASRANEPLSFFAYGIAERAALVMKKEGEGQFPVRYDMQKTEFGFKVTVNITTSGLYFYSFEIDGERYGSDDMCNLTKDGPDFLQLVYDGNFHPLGGKVIYQIFPDRFYGGKCGEEWYSTPSFLPDEKGRYNTQFYGGTLQGITQKLDYIKSLNVTHIYLNPIFSSPSNHRYDTSDYEKVDSLLGTEDDLKELIRAAAENKIGIILDGVFSHTGDDSKYFDKYGNYGGGAYRSKDSPYYCWYDFFDYPDGYRCWWGISSLPEVDELNSSYMEYMLGKNGIVRKWESFGIAGWRLDVADELPDGFLDRLRTVSDVTLIGEVWENAARKVSYGDRRRYFCGQLDGVTNYPIRNGIIDFITKRDNTALRRTVREIISDYPSEVFSSLMNLLDTHDTLRILTALSDGELPCSKEERAEVRHGDEARKRLVLASLIQYFLPGVPCIYYGDEAGLSGCEDPFCRRAYPWGREDKELIEYYRSLGKLRSLYAPFFEGGAEERSTKKDVFILVRTSGKERIVLVVNLSDCDVEADGVKVKNGCGAVILHEKIVFDTASY